MKIAQRVNAMTTEAAAAAVDLHMMTCCLEPIYSHLPINAESLLLYYN